MTTKLVVHALFRGLPLCGFSDKPSADWPENNRWIPTVPDCNLSEITCPGCKARAQELEKDQITSTPGTPAPAV